MAKRAREQALREKRERKREKKEAAALRRAEGLPSYVTEDGTEGAAGYEPLAGDEPAADEPAPGSAPLE